MIHQLKIESKYFEKIAAGLKTFEVRNNDRDFHVGDYLGLNETLLSSQAGEYKETGNFVLVRVTDVFDDDKFVRDGYVVLSIVPCRIFTENVRQINVYTEDFEELEQEE